jgi:hypothetical protein
VTVHLIRLPAGIAVTVNYYGDSVVNSTDITVTVHLIRLPGRNCGDSAVNFGGGGVTAN